MNIHYIDICPPARLASSPSPHVRRGGEEERYAICGYLCPPSGFKGAPNRSHLKSEVTCAPCLAAIDLIGRYQALGGSVSRLIEALERIGVTDDIYALEDSMDQAAVEDLAERLHAEVLDWEATYGDDV